MAVTTRLAMVAFAVLAAQAVCMSAKGGTDAPSPPRPEPLETLRSSLDNQEEFERRIRAFDVLHVAMARRAYLEARELEEKGEKEAAAAASDRAQALLDMVKDAYDLGLAHFENSAPLHNYYGELMHDFFSRIREAYAHWKRAVQLDPAFARAHNNLGMYSCHIGMYSAGLTHLETALELEPRNPDYLFNMAQIYLVHFPEIMQLKDISREKVYQEAMKMSERAAQLRPDDFELLRDYALNFFTAETFGVKADWRKAAKAWQAAREVARNDMERFNAWLNEARVHIRNGDKKRADACLEQARSIWPDSPVVRSLLEDFRG